MIKATRLMEAQIASIMENAEDAQQGAAMVAELMAEMAYTSMREGRGQPMIEIWRKTLEIMGMEQAPLNP